MQSRRFLLSLSGFPVRLGAMAAGACLLFLLGLVGPSYAQAGDDISLYEVPDVGVDITADSAVHARDKAIAAAQRQALELLLGRFGADSNLASKLSDDDVAALVQNFEVQNERTSSVRYIGTFTVQFRPMATREWLTGAGANFTETRSKPIIVLPILMSQGHGILWEERTKWWSAWESARNSGLVPVTLPSGGLDDIATLSTEEAVDGDLRAIKALIDKYDAGGAAIVVFDGNLETPGTAFKIRVTRYDAAGTPGVPQTLTVPAVSDKAAIDGVFMQGVKLVRGVLEDSWRQVVAKSTQAPAAKLPVVVPIDSIDQWTAIKRKLSTVHAIEKINTVMLARGMTNIELEYRGTPEQLQEELMKQGLTLAQDNMNGSWVLQQAVPGSHL